LFDVDSVSACPTVWLAARADRLSAAATSADVRVKPVINAYPGPLDGTPSACPIR